MSDQPQRPYIDDSDPNNPIFRAQVGTHEYAVSMQYVHRERQQKLASLLASHLHAAYTNGKKEARAEIQAAIRNALMLKRRTHMTKCDLCNQSCPISNIVQLRDQYRIPEVVDLCPDCARWADKVKSDLLDKIAPKMREAIAEKKGVSLIQRPTFLWRFLK